SKNRINVHENRAQRILPRVMEFLTYRVCASYASWILNMGHSRGWRVNFQSKTVKCSKFTSDRKLFI
ncbi:hypothetical protein, partial [Pseudomonas tremae]|uniref:hypothetical protein n=1 Tax=Pseudomonas tremae TaxID=200454 RepID=UPI001F3F1A7D